MKKIYCVEAQKEGFDDLSTDDIKKMVGWVEPEEENGKVSWHVTLMDGYYETETQDAAMLIANTEMNNAMLIQLLEKEVNK